MAKKLKKKKVNKIIRGHLLNFWACSLIIVLASMGTWYGLAKAEEIPMRPAERTDDGKFAEQMQKPVLCDVKGRVFDRYYRRGYENALRSFSTSGFSSYILLRRDTANVQLTDMVIIEVDPSENTACLVFEGNGKTEYNSDYLELMKIGIDI